MWNGGLKCSEHVISTFPPIDVSFTSCADTSNLAILNLTCQPAQAHSKRRHTVSLLF